MWFFVGCTAHLLFKLNECYIRIGQLRVQGSCISYRPVNIRYIDHLSPLMYGFIMQQFLIRLRFKAPPRTYPIIPVQIVSHLGIGIKFRRRLNYWSGVGNWRPRWTTFSMSAQRTLSPQLCKQVKPPVGRSRKRPMELIETHADRKFRPTWGRKQRTSKPNSTNPL